MLLGFNLMVFLVPELLFKTLLKLNQFNPFAQSHRQD
jgi:hypothetical protein